MAETGEVRLRLIKMKRIAEEDVIQTALLRVQEDKWRRTDVTMKDDGMSIPEWLINEQLGSMIQVSSLLVEVLRSDRKWNGYKWR